ncbi:MAG: ECF transporter S component [Defluviitaleaceae bacterium]|nr:ECF transporter S component [Defluviitaleaceae bacterium]
MENNFNTRKITTLGIMTAFSLALVTMVRFPIIPAARFLEYDPADIPILIATFAYGPFAGIVVTFIASVIQGMTVSAESGPYGIIMHILSTGSFVLTAGMIYKLRRNKLGAGVGIICGVLVSVAVMVAANLIVTPMFLDLPMEAVKGMLIPAIIPFNLLKSSINGAITFFVYKSVSRFLRR